MDIFDKIPEVKRELLKFCKQFEARLRRNVQTHRVIPQVQTTDIMVPGFIVDKSARGNKRLGPSKINLQFLEHHKHNYLELHHDLAKISYSPQTDAALTDFKTLLELEISLLMGCDTEWAEPSDFAEPDAASAVGAVLGAARRSDDDDVSSNDGAAAAAAPPAASAARAAAAPPAASAAASAARAAAAPPAASAAAPPAASAAPAAGAASGPPPASAAPAAPAALAGPAAPAGGDGPCGAGGAGEGAVHDLHDYTTWAQETWTGIDLSQI